MRLFRVTSLATALILALPIHAASVPDTSRALKTLMGDGQDAPSSAVKEGGVGNPSENTVMVVRGDTLAKILARYPGMMPPTRSQIFRAVVALNPHAFIGGNPNRLIAGAQLQIPDPDELFAVATGRRGYKASKKESPSDAKAASSYKGSGSNHRQDPHAGWVRFPSR